MNLPVITPMMQRIAGIAEAAQLGLLVNLEIVLAAANVGVPPPTAEAAMNRLMPQLHQMIMEEIDNPQTAQ